MSTADLEATIAELKRFRGEDNYRAILAEQKVHEMEARLQVSIRRQNEMFAKLDMNLTLIANLQKENRELRKEQAILEKIRKALKIA